MIKDKTNNYPKSKALDFEEKRSHKRIPVKIDTTYFYGNMYYSGQVLDLSEAGMFINTKRSLPFGATLVVLFRNEKGHVRTIARVKRVQRNTHCDGLGVELLRPPKSYLNFVKNLKNTD